MTFTTLLIAELISVRFVFFMERISAAQQQLTAISGNDNAVTRQYAMLAAITSSSIEPNRKPMICRLKSSVSTMMQIAMKHVVMISCVAESRADFSFFAPRNCDATTAPPVEIAAKMLIRKLFIMSTSDTPDTLASPNDEIIIVSTEPTRQNSICSKASGMTRRHKSLSENNLGSNMCYINIPNLSSLSSLLSL